MQEVSYVSRLTTRLATFLLVISLTIFLVSGCEKRLTLDNASWCDLTRSDLTANSIDWPVANQSLKPSQFLAILPVMQSRVSDLQDTDLKFAVEAWIHGYKIALPYLTANNQRAFEFEVSESRKKQLHYANVAITDICQW